jgi:hypothetical protein
MSRSPVYRGAGNLKLRGKKSMLLPCKCCEAIDLRQYVHDKEISKEMKEFSIEQSNRESPKVEEQSTTDKEPSHLTRLEYPSYPTCCYKHASIEQRMSYMILCPECGNKRCPKSTDCSLSCTGSNEPGQSGSRYA